MILSDFYLCSIIKRNWCLHSFEGLILVNNLFLSFTDSTWITRKINSVLSKLYINSRSKKCFLINTEISVSEERQCIESNGIYIKHDISN